MAKSNYFEDNAEFKFDKDLDYPRSELTKVRNENPSVLTCEYELSDDIIESIEDDFAEGIVAEKAFSVKRDDIIITLGIAEHHFLQAISILKLKFKNYQSSFLSLKHRADIFIYTFGSDGNSGL